MPDYKRQREDMVETQLVARGIRDAAVLDAMRVVPRHEFVPEGVREFSYADQPLPIGHRQTISQPLIVATMLELARPKRGDRILDIGCGSGYQAAILAALGAEVYGIEIVAQLAERAASDLKRLGYQVTVRAGDGYAGWPERAPFAAILVAAAPTYVPVTLKQQLAIGGRLILPVGDRSQELRVIERRGPEDYIEWSEGAVLFVPMTGKVQEEGVD